MSIRGDRCPVGQTSTSVPKLKEKGTAWNTCTPEGFDATVTLHLPYRLLLSLACFNGQIEGQLTAKYYDSRNELLNH